MIFLFSKLYMISIRRQVNVPDRNSSCPDQHLALRYFVQPKRWLALNLLQIKQKLNKSCCNYSNFLNDNNNIQLNLYVAILKMLLLTSLYLYVSGSFRNVNSTSGNWQTITFPLPIKYHFNSHMVHSDVSSLSGDNFQ